MAWSRRTLALVLSLVVVALLGVGLWWWSQRPASRWDEAARLAPADAERLLFTDWAGVRRDLGVDGSSPKDLRELMDRAYEEDLSAASALPESAEAMRSSLGVSPADVEWELLSQGPDGAAVFLRLPDDLDVAALEERLEGLGYTRPEESDGTWQGGENVAAAAGFSPQLQYVGVLADDRLLVASDRAAYLDVALETVRGDRDPVVGLEEIVAEGGEPLSAIAYSGAYACEKLAMAQADPDDVAAGEQLINRVGELHPMSAFAVTVSTDGRAEVLMSFESQDSARADVDPRAALARGPAPGQGGDFSDRFTVTDASSEGELLRLRLEREPDSYLLSDLTSGPVLFASC